jgi:hypothetical protein
MTGATRETDDSTTNEATFSRKRLVSERSEVRKPQEGKSEQRTKSKQSKSQREQDADVSNQRRLSALSVHILEAAGDKYVPDAVTDLSIEKLISAIEAVGDKDVAPPRSDLAEDWQRARAQQLMSE